MDRKEVQYGAPIISFKPGYVLISGRSVMIEPSRLYNELLDKFHSYLSSPLDQTEIHIALDYMNSISNRHMMNFLILAEKLFSQGKRVDVYWYFDSIDEGTKEQGAVFKDLLNLPFHFVERND